MSRNGSYAKSMNGIVSFDDGDGTVIEGDGITTGIINCTTLTASSTVNTPTINTDFIGKKANSYITVLNNTTFNGDINVDNINANTGTIYLKNNTSITGTLALTSNIQTAYLEGRGIGGVGSPLNIGQSNDLTSYVNIGRDAITAGGFVFPAIPVRTTYIPTSNYDIVNKLYVDNATAGTNILALSNTFTGTTNTFNNTIATNNIQSIITTTWCRLFNDAFEQLVHALRFFRIIFYILYVIVITQVHYIICNYYIQRNISTHQPLETLILSINVTLTVTLTRMHLSPG